MTLLKTLCTLGLTGIIYSSNSNPLIAPDTSKIQESKEHHILADSLKSKEVLVYWGKNKDRAYIGKGIPTMTPRDTLNLPDNVKGRYELIIYNFPEGVSTNNNSIFTSGDVKEGIINGALIYKNKKGKITESVRIIVPVFRGKLDSRKISELEKKIINLEKNLKKEKDKQDFNLIMNKYLTKIDSIIESSPEIGNESKGPRSSARIIGDILTGESGFRGGNVGVGYGPVAVLINYSKKDDEIVKEVNVPLSRGRRGVGSEIDKEFNSIGAYLEIVPVNQILFGGGINKWNYTKMVDEKVVSKEGETLNANFNSKSQKKVSNRFYAGFDIPVKKDIGIRVLAGKDSFKGWFVGSGMSFRLNKKPNKRKK